MKSNKRKIFLVPEEEPYQCEHCDTSVMGGRYNNHCPSCLWSKHVDDKIPGDRASDCGGLMEPVGVIKKHDTWRLIQKCITCEKQFVVDSAPQDNFDIIVELSQKPTHSR
ncbi:MAG: RNHCP domain-containing protein [Patescibacteria group bacterium]